MIRIRENKKVKLLGICIIVLIFLMIVLVINKSTYSFDLDSSIGDYVINPEWVEYINLSDEEKNKYEVIPEEYIYQYKRKNDLLTSIFSKKNKDKYPEYYNLLDYGYTTEPDNQGSLGICWAFAAANAMESYLLRIGMSDISNPVKFSTRQMDYASVDKDSVKEGFNPYYMFGRNYIGSAAKFNTGFVLMSSGISPVTIDKFGDSIVDTSMKSISEVIDLDNVSYVIDSYINYGSLGDYTSEEDRNSWINDIKEHLLNYGAVAISVKGTSVYSAGSCIHLTEDRTNFLVNQNGECNASGYGGHAMTIIGYDDNYTYKYCRLESSTSNDLTNCDNIVSGKGAFILKNSWGENYQYPYLAYSSNVDGSYGITGVSTKDWDINYDSTKENDNDYKYKLSSITYYKSDKIREKLKKISFYVNNSSEIDYNVYVSVDGSDNYKNIGTYTIDRVGLNSIYIDEDIILNSDKFIIKITSNDGYVDRIYAFSEKVDNNDDVILDTVIKNNIEYEFNSSSLSIYTVTNNIKNGDLIEYKLYDSEGLDITDILDITNNYNLNSQVKPVIKIKSVLSSGNLTLKTIYNNTELDSDLINVSSLENLWSGGNGTVDNPYLIKNIDDFKKIFTNEEYLGMNYKLIDDLDFSNEYDWNAGKLSNFTSFSGSLDGDNHMIMGLSAGSNIPSIFYSLNNASVKNLIFSESILDVKESGWGNLVAIMSYDSSLENIVITKSVKIMGDASYAGGLIGTAYNTDFKHIAVYSSIDVNYEYNGRASGIVNEGYGISILECYNYGDIKTSKSTVGGLVAILHSVNSRVSVIKDSYNQGNIVSSITGGGIVGFGENSLIENTYNIFSKDINNNIGNIIGTSSNMVINNSYYYNKYGLAFNIDSNSSTSLNNVIGLDIDDLKEENNYINFDFIDIWEINREEYPNIRNFNYYYLLDILVEDNIKLQVGEEFLLDVSFSPVYVSNKKIKYVIDDNSIININNNIITGLKSGTTNLKIYSLDGSSIIKNIVVEVILDYVNLDNYEVVNDKYIKILEKYNPDIFINSIYQGNKYRIEVDSKNLYIATGDKINIFKDNIIDKEYIAFILGDTTGDSVINVADVAKLYQHIRKKDELEYEFQLAGDVYKDSKIALNDVAKLYQYIRGGIDGLEN